jgi:hypothetical protein
MNADYTRMACEVLRQLQGHRARALAALINDDNALLIAVLRLNSDRYYELVQWGLTPAQRECLDDAIRAELERGV